MGVRLPAEYQEVEYVQATGTQAFFTDVPIQDGLTVDSVQTFAMGDNYLFGGNNGNVQICFNGTYNSRLQSSYNGYYYWTGGFDVQTNNTTKYHVVQTQRNGSQIGFLDDVQILNGTRSTTKDTSAGKTAALFGQRNASDVLNAFYKGKVYSCKVSKDGTLLADFVPCYRKADGEIGMYDLVLQKFYVNEGTGVFLKGADVIDSISPWLVAWRRMLMRKPPLDTSPRIAEYGKHLNRSNTDTTVSANYCYTEWYDLNFESYTKLTMNYARMPESAGITYQYRNTETGAADWYYFPNKKTIEVKFNQIRFSIAISHLRDCYLYFQETGEILFAGKDTIYYGHRNISEIT